MKTSTFRLLALAGIAVALVGCNDHHKKVKVQHETVKIEKLKPGNSHHADYAYQDNSGFWWYYIMMTQTTNSSPSTTSTSSYSFPSASGAGRVSLPPGGSWSKGQTAPEEEEVEPGQEQEATVDETAEAGPLTEAQESQVDQATGTVEEPTEATGTESTTGSESTSGGEATSGGDTGGSGGGDAGGGGGGDGGGGGGDGGGGGGD
jgi:hypothetical protein